MKSSQPTVKRVTAGSRDFARLLERLRSRGAGESTDVEQSVRRIVSSVKRRGDAALVEFTRKFDGVSLRPGDFLIKPADLAASCKKLKPADLRALKLAARRIRDFHRRQLERSWRYADSSGMKLGQKVEALERVGIYVPGGTASYPSSVLMNVIPAKVAGVREVIVVSPPSQAPMLHAVYAAASIAGADAFFSIGGAQAVAALAYGTKSVPRVDKICGPGNVYVAAAKRLVFGQVDIDMVAGPSEVLVIADGSASAKLVAADMLAQAEHDRLAAAVLVTTSKRLAAQVEAELLRQLEDLPRRDIARASLRQYGAILVVGTIKEAVALANVIAPEHLEIMVKRPRSLVPLIKHAGAIFLGDNTPESLGDYVAGPSHVLPTGGTARFSSPLGVYDFLKRSSVIEASPGALAHLGPAAARIAEMEGLKAHALAVYRRLGYNGR